MTEPDQRRFRLARRFRKQQFFAIDTSPLTACLCGIVADWLDDPFEENGPASWLLNASRECSSFAVPMLLMAGLHRAILEGQRGMQPLAEYFPSVGGLRPVSKAAIEPCLRSAVLEHREQLALFLQSVTVQTNETARGICWLLPVLYSGWPAMHLMDLGCSAGLNLVADQRHYRLQGENVPHTGIGVGHGRPEQFVLTWTGDFVPPTRLTLPQILARTGCDLHPFHLSSEQKEQTLASFVWGDQVRRLEMLRQGVAAFKEVRSTNAPVQLVPANLPDDLHGFLNLHLSVDCTAPLVIYNTYLTPYLDQKGKALGNSLEQYALLRAQPVLWLQWEPMHQGPAPPMLGWLGWSADLWMNGQHHQWLLAWVHPHGSEVQWLPGFAQWAEFWNRHNA